MPIIKATTKDSKKIWSGGGRSIWDINLDVGGQTFKTKTYSEAIADVGFSGELESYEKEGKFGTETFVRQKPKEGGYSGSSGSSASSTAQTPKYEMYLSYAKDLLVAMLETKGYDKAEFLVLLKAMIQGGNLLHNSRPDAPRSEPDKDALNEVFPDAEKLPNGEDPFTEDEIQSLPL